MGNKLKGTEKQKELKKATKILENLKGLDISEMTDQQIKKMVYALSLLQGICDEKGVVK